MRKMICLLTALLLLAALPLGAFAERDIQAMVDELPTAEQIQEMDPEDQRKAYDQVQEAYDIYMALGDDRLKIVGGEEKFDLLFSWFNMQIMPLESAAEEPAETTGSVWPYAVLAAAAVFLFLCLGKRKIMG